MCTASKDQLTVERVELFFIWQKASKVIASCETQEQLSVASKYVELASRRQNEYRMKIREGLNK